MTAGLRGPQTEMLRVADIAATLGLSTMTIYRRIHSRELRAHKVGRSYLIDQRDFIAFMRSNTTWTD